MDQGDFEEINCSETNGAVLKGRMAPFIRAIGMMGIVVSMASPKWRRQILPNRWMRRGCIFCMINLRLGV